MDMEDDEPYTVISPDPSEPSNKMVCCKFFQQGNCRFGSKCHNEHIDLKQLVKADVEAAVNGKQWPFSCYGPFKDKPCIPNFIDDLSFEEVRLMCYEAKQKNCFEQFHQQFSSAALEVSGKMKALAQFTPDVLGTIINVYDSTNVSAEMKKPNNNPFGLGSSTSVAGGQSMLGKSNEMNVNIFSSTGGKGSGDAGFNGGLFLGNANTNSGSFFGNNSSLFGQKDQQQTSIFGQTSKQNSSIFGATNNSAQDQNGMFNQTPAPTLNGNIFAQTSQQQQQQTHPTFGLFSQALEQQASVSNGHFNPTQPQQQTEKMFGLVTLQPSQSANQSIFNHATNMQQNHAFYAQTNQQQSLGNQSLFTQPTQQFQQNDMYEQQPLENAYINQQQQQQQQNQQGIQNTLQQTQPTQNIQATNQTDNESVYSRMEELTADEMGSFNGDSFFAGNLPLNPPPKEFIHKF